MPTPTIRGLVQGAIAFMAVGVSVMVHTATAKDLAGLVDVGSGRSLLPRMPWERRANRCSHFRRMGGGLDLDLRAAAKRPGPGSAV